MPGIKLLRKNIFSAEIKKVLLQKIREGIKWLNRKQNKNAYCSHLGIHFKLNNMLISITPFGANNTVVVNIKESIRKEFTDKEWTKRISELTKFIKDTFQMLKIAIVDIWDGGYVGNEGGEYWVSVSLVIYDCNAVKLVVNYQKMVDKYGLSPDKKQQKERDREFIYAEIPKGWL
jgi:hypothetical protein